MTIIDAIRAVQADPTLAMRATDSESTYGMFPLRYAGGQWEFYSGDYWGSYFDEGELTLTADEILAEWETVPVAAVEAAGVRA